MAEQKKNDWLATLFFSPDKTPQDLANLGITTDNSSLQDKDYYKNIPQIQEAFKNESGNFDSIKFDKYYQGILQLYNDADNAKLESSITDFYSYDPYDYFAPKEGKKRDIAPKIIKFANPERRSRGLINLREASAPTMSLREVAQQNKVFNIDTQTFEDWTPNDWGGLSALTRPTLVLAQWDEDGTHEVNGRLVTHKAGDYKFNNNGDPFYETLGSRSLTGKDILHISDTLTIDGSKWNKYDFFDSDGLDKSAVGTIAKTVFKVAPMFLPYVGKVYGSMTAAIELGKLLPILYKSIEGIANGDISTSESAQTATDIQAWFSRFDGSLSDKGRQGFFNLENLGKLVEDSSMQLFQQRQISKLPLLFTKKGSNISENAIKWGRGISLAYMAGTSSTEAYDAFKKAGADDRIAGLGMISVMGAMFGLMNNDYFKDFWFKDTYLDKSKLRSVIKESAKQLADKEFSAYTVNQITTAKGAAKWVIDMQKSIMNRISKVKPGDLMYDTLNEGIEETIEEVTTDTVKAFYSGLNTLGIIDKNKSYNFGITPEDMFSRYLTSFAGGAIGGAVFSLHNKWESRNNPILTNAIKDGGDGFKEIIYYLRSGKEQELRRELDRLYKSGKLASTNLSGTDFEIVKDGSNKVQYKAADLGNSQNDLIYKQIGYYIDRIGEVIKEEGLDLSDLELQFITTQSEFLGRPVEQIKQDYINAKKELRNNTITEQIVDSGLYNKLFEDWNDLTAQIIQTKVNLEGLLTPGETESKTPKDIEAKIEAMSNNSEYQQLRLKLDNLRAERDAIISGEKNDYYTGQLLFAASPQLVNNFISGFGVHNFTKYKYNKDYNTLTDAEREKINSEYQVYSNTQEKSRVLTAYDIFSQMQEKMIPSIIDVARRVKDSSGIYIPETTQYKLLFERANKILSNKKSELNELLKSLPENINTNDTIDKLKSDIDSLEKYIEAIKGFKFAVLNPALSEKGEELLSRSISNDNDNVLQFANYAITYKDYLNYIKNNNLYLDLVDSDLASILQGWVSVNNLTDNTILSWASKIHQELIKEDLELDLQDSFILDLASKLVDVTSAIKNNDIDTAIRLYNEIGMSDLLDSAEMLGVDLNKIIEILLPNIGSDSFIDYLNEINNLKSQINSSPAYDLIGAASKIVNLDNVEILDLIRNEENNFLNSKSVEDYIIRDKNALIQLKETKQIIDAISAILDASVEGNFNSRINSYREQLQKELLPIITVEANVNLVKDLNRIATQLQTLIDISERNQAQKLREQKDIAINMRQKFINLLINPDSLIKDRFAAEFGLELEKLIEEINIPSEVTDENYKDLEQGAIKLETAIFNHINGLNLTSSEISQKLVSLFNIKELISGKPTKLNKDPNTVITDFDQLIYLATIIATPSQNFYNELTKIIEDPNFTNAPIFSQEYAVRVGYSQILNKEIFNSLISEIKKQAKEASSDEYIQTKSILPNIITIYGGAGVGKTKGVAYLLKLLVPDISVITSAPTRRQTDNLSISINHDKRSFTKDELIDKVLGRPLQESDIKPISNVSITSDINLKVNSDNLFGDSKNKLLFIDEVSWYNRIELELISKWARQNNISVVALGDYKQNSSFTIFDNRRIDCGIEDTYVIKTPDLTAPLRPDNIAKYDNYIRLSEALDKVYEQYYNDPSINPSILDTFTKEYLSANKISFKYFENESIFGGEKFISDSEINKYIDTFKRLSNDIAIITDKPEKYNTIKGVKVTSLNSVQGEEFDYVIIDKNFGLDDTGKGRGEYYKLKDLYTLTQRSRKGTAIVNKGFSTDYSSKNDPTSIGNIEIPQSQILDFKEWRNSLLKELPSETINWEPKEILLPVDLEQKTPQIETSEKTDSKIEEPEVVSKETEIINISPKSNSVTQDSFSSVPSQVIDVEEVTDSSNLEEPEVSQVAIPVVSLSDVVSTAESYIEFIKNDLINYYKNSDRSFQKYLGINNPEDIVKLTNLLRAYFVYGYYKNNNPKLEVRSNKAKNKITQLVRNINPSAIVKIRDLVNIPYKFSIVPYNQKGLLVAQLGEVDIPLLITDPQIGDYYGDIEIASKFKTTKIGENEELSILDVSDFKNSEINTNKLFQVFTEPVILSASGEELDTLEQSQRDWVSRNNGRTFFLVSNDPFLDNNDFKAFLEPTTIDNEIRWTTQHDDSISIIGMNWVTDFETILKVAKTHSKNKQADSIINSNRAGQIIGIAFQVAPEIVTQRVKGYFKDTNNTLRVKIGNEIISDAESVESILNKYKGQNPDIVFGYFDSKRGFVSDLKGEWSINRVFENKRNVLNFNQSQLDKISRLCKESSKFKQGIYARDIRRGNINGIYRSTDLGNIYITNIKSLIGNDFKIDNTKINLNNTSITNDLVNKLNLQLAELGINNIITDQSSIKTTLDSINNNIISSITNPTFEILTFDGNDIKPNKVEDIRYMISNYLKTSIDSINISEAKTSKFGPFYVSLQDQINNYVAEEKDGNWSIREFPIINDYIEFFNFTKVNENKFKRNIDISKYITALINNEDIDLKTVENYWNIVSIEPVYTELQQQVNKYLMSKLTNNEC